MKKIFSILFLLATFVGMAQQQNIPLNREFNLINQKVFNSTSLPIHTSFQPMIQSQTNGIKMDSILSNDEQKKYLTNINKSYRRDRSWVMRKLFFENFIIVDTGNFYLTVDPLLNLELGQESLQNSTNSLYINTRGLLIRANVGEKFSFETSVYENQTVVPTYIDNYVTSHNGEGEIIGVMPGQGRVKSFKNNGYDFASSSAVITYTPAKFLNLQLGTGKNFVGDGYRSLLLSDFSFNYPFLKITSTFGKHKQFQYTQLNASLSSVIRRDLSATPEALFVRKSMSTHYFNWLPSNWLAIGLFETTMWNTEDSTGTKPFVYQQLNPIIGINTITTATHDKHHSNFGINAKFKLPFNTVVYGQFVMDGNQYEETTGFQAGIRFQKIKGFTLQAEYNQMRNPYATTYEPFLESFTNYNEPIAHPLGDNFKEFVGIINYKYKRIFTQFKSTLAELSEIDTKIMNIDYHLGYLINSKNNLTFVVGSKLRTVKATNDYTTNIYYIGLRTNLRNLYNDF